MGGYIVKNIVSEFTNNFTVTKDMDNSIPPIFSDMGGDAFDGFGGFKIVSGTNSSIQTNLPFTNKNGADGVIYSETFTHDSVDWKIDHGWIANGIFMIQLKQISGTTKTFKLTFSGNYGSDGSTSYGSVQTNFSGKYIKTFWNNDDGQDGTGGDPQVTWTVVPYEVSKISSSTPVASTSRSGDNETGTTINLSYGCIYFLQVGYTTVQAIQDWIISNITLDYDKKYLIIDGTDVKNWSGSTYQKIGDMPLTEEMFNTYGMTTINVLRTGIVSDTPTLAMWTDDVTGTIYTLREIVVPKPKLMLMNYDFSVPTGTKTFEIVSTVSGNALIRVVCSIDSGTTWKSWYNNTWTTVDINSSSDIETKGMTPTIANSLTTTAIDLLGNTTQIRFGCYLKQTVSTESCSVDILRVNFK
jgi:hypothetical protein